MTIHWKAVEQYFTVVLFVNPFISLSNITVEYRYMTLIKFAVMRISVVFKCSKSEIFKGFSSEFKDRGVATCTHSRIVRPRKS